MATPAFSSCTIFLNRSSGWSDRLEERERLVELLGPGRTTVQLVEKGASIPDLVRRAVEGGCQAVVAAGGDGTIRAAAEAVAGTGATLGILPAGTLNHFARDLNIPLDMEAAARVLLDAATLEVDVAEVNGRVFVNNSTIGLYPAYRFKRDEEERKGRNRVTSFLSSALAIARRYPMLGVRFVADGRTFVRRTPIVIVANNEHKLEGYELGTRERLDAGRLWVYIVRPRPRWRMLALLARLALGRLRKEREMEYFSATEVWIETSRRRLGVALDGEVTLMETPLHYRIRPRALKVLAPRA